MKEIFPRESTTDKRLYLQHENGGGSEQGLSFVYS